MSMTKYASNAIEKCLEKFPDYLTSIFIDEILIGQKLLELMRNNFGNYVIQKALKTAKGNSKEKLLSAIKKNIEKLNDIKLVTKWNQILDISELKIMPEFHSMPINNPAYINNPNDLAQCMNFNMINMNNMQGFQRNNLNLLDPYRMPNSPCLRPLSYNSMLPLKMMQGSPRSMNIPYDNNFPTGSSLQSRSNKLSSNTSLRSCNIESSQLNLQSMVFGQLGQLDHSMFNSGNMQGGRQNPQIRNHHYSNEFADFDSGINGIANLQPMQHMPNNKTYNLDKGMFKDDSDMKNNHSINSNKVEPISESSIESSGMSKENSSSPVKRAKKYTIKILPENNK